MADELPPDWAIARAIELVAAANAVEGPMPTVEAVKSGKYAGYTIFAAYIAQHEQEPVDPLLLVAREICAATARMVLAPSEAHRFRDGIYDRSSALQFTLTKLREVANA